MRRNPTTTCNHVQGSQINNYTYQYQIFEQREKEHTIYDEYHKVISGDVYKFPDIFQGTDSHDSYSSGEYRIFKAKTMICHAEVQGRQGFTMVSYKGEHAKELWEHDFRQFAEQRDARKIQLFGINHHSSIPFLIFHSELIPVAQIQDRIQDKMTRRLTGGYLMIISKMLGTFPWCIWLDSKTGALIHGTEGPDAHWHPFYLSSTTPPSNLTFLQKDVFWQYLLQLPKNQEPDNMVVEICCSMYIELEHVIRKTLSPDQCQPMVVSTLTNSPIAIGSPIWDIHVFGQGSSKPERTMWQDGTTRFSFAGFEASEFSLHHGFHPEHMWFTQALSVFHHLGISLDEDLSQFGLIHSSIHLIGRFDCSHDKLQQHENLQSFHLFIPPIPPFPLLENTYVSGWHYWSFDPSGQTSISEDKCRKLGLPTQLFLDTCSVYQNHYSTETYKTLHRWQVERGFDPKTTDFARYLYPSKPLWQVIESDSSHFTEVDHEDA
ncbi:hypothetical protein L218DRAFT_958973 [Marasmius fiardii PR-910]|nr:hypothetical protein L218DRAFT_958973 [Marasmius fiardii PR-910]